MNDIQLRWITRTETVPHERDEYPSWKVKTKVLQYRKYYDRAVRAGFHSDFRLGGSSDWCWSDWMDVPDA